MEQFFALAIDNVTSPMVLFFALGVAASILRSDLEIPQAAAKFLAIYLMLAIGFKGGAAVAANGFEFRLASTLLAGAALSLLLPVVAFFILRRTSTLPAVDAAAISAHYGSISIVTLASAIQALAQVGLDYEGYIVAVAAVMEFPAIVSGLWLAHRYSDTGSKSYEGLFRHVLLNGSIVVLVGAFIIGWISGEDGLTDLAPLIVDPFKGILCLFLLDMGLIAGRGFRDQVSTLGLSEIAFGLLMPIVSGILAAGVAVLLDLSVGGTALFITMSASASYIAVPAAMRLALPQAKPSNYLTMSLGLTFPFNLTIGIPIYIAMAQMVA